MPDEISSTGDALRISRERRRAEIDQRQNMIASLLHDAQCEFILILNPANFRWLTAGADLAGLYARDEHPAIFFNNSQRWLIASNVDAQRLFDEEINAMGFQLKEWPWIGNRDLLLAEMVYGRKVCCDTPFRDCKTVSNYLSGLRRQLSGYETDQMESLGKMVAHALEATGRNISQGDREEEIAGHLAHRLLKHGIEPIYLQVSGDGRSRNYRRRSFGAMKVEKWVVIQATGKKNGLHITASRTVCFGNEIPADIQAEYNAALKMATICLTNASPNERVSTTLEAGRESLLATSFEHEWRNSPPVVLTGREASEIVLTPSSTDRWLPNWAAIWQPRIGATAVVDTYLLEEGGWKTLTPSTEWPVRRSMLHDRAMDFPDIHLMKD
jgi:Xaa-Pro dipeptidase